MNIFINKFNKKSEKLTEFILGSRKRSGDLDFGLDGNVLPEDVNYYREIPSNKDLERMLTLQKSLLYFTTSLQGNEMLLEKLENNRNYRGNFIEMDKKWLYNSFKNGKRNFKFQG